MRFVEPGFDENTPDGKLMAMYMCMEMLLDYPDLIWWSGTEYEKDSPNGSAYAHQLMTSGVFRTGSQPKLDRLISEIQFLLDSDQDSKIIVVSKYKFMLGIIELILQSKDIKSAVFTGDLNAKQKAQAVDQFSQPDTRVFLTSYAGGYGLDLYMADYLINYDLPWSAGTKDQINSRHIRASSEFGKVYIRNMLMAGSVEERKMRILDRKSQLLTSVLDSADSKIIDISGDFLRTHLEDIVEKGLDRTNRTW
jgi:SNF2 family DNA or RNA helicase